MSLRTRFFARSCAVTLAMGTLVALAALVNTGVAYAQDWQHVSLVSAEGVAVNVDYTTKKDVFNGCYKCTVYTRADTLWINVQAPGLTAADSVRAVLVNNRYALWTRPNPTDIETRELDLVPAGNGRFTVNAGSLPTFGAGYGGNEDFVLEIALVVNGQWLKDPVSRTSNFRVELAQD